MTYDNGQKLYLSAIMDLGAKDIVIYTIGERSNNHLVFSNLDLAIEKYPEAQLLFHSDRGPAKASKRNSMQQE